MLMLINIRTFHALSALQFMDRDNREHLLWVWNMNRHVIYLDKNTISKNGNTYPLELADTTQSRLLPATFSELGDETIDLSLKSNAIHFSIQTAL